MLSRMSVSLLTLVLVAANLFGAAMAVPQVWKILRTGSSEGVSLSWAVLSATVNAGWGWYGLGVGDLGIVPVSLASVLSYLLIALLVARHRRQCSEIVRAMVAATSAACAVVAAGWFAGWPAAGIVLGALYAVQLSPAVVSVYRAFDVSGVSVSTWVIAFVEAVLWGVYGLVRLDIGLMALAVSGIFMAGLVLARLAVRRPRRIRHQVAVPGFAIA